MNSCNKILQEGLTKFDLWFIVKMLDEVLNEHLIRKNLREEAEMLTVNPIKLNNINTISFKEGNLNNITPNLAILSLQNPNAKINFENDLIRTGRADMVQNPSLLNAGWEKLVKTYSILKPNKPQNQNNAKHISFLG